MFEHYSRSGYELKFVCETKPGWSNKHSNVISVHDKRSPVETLDRSSLKAQFECGEYFLSTLNELKSDGYQPDLIISHTGWGSGLYAKYLFPNAKLIAYSELWFQVEHGRNMYLRNSTQAVELCEADYVVTATDWQRNHLPQNIRKDALVIHEGTNTALHQLNYSWKSKDNLIITYATRGMESLRGFDIFVKAIKVILERHENIKVYVAGEDKVFYGKQLAKNLTYGEWARKLLYNEIESKKVLFCGKLPYLEYARLLKKSHLHVYLTKEFVPSWSLFDALAAGCIIVSNKNRVTEEILGKTRNLLCAELEEKQLISKLEEGINLIKYSASESKSIRSENRSLAENSYSRDIALMKWTKLVEKCLRH